jgi:alkylated DNA repair dioxygenase AlkB
MAAEQIGLFAPSLDLPQGFRYATDVISRKMETELLEKFKPLPFKEFEFQGYLGKRRVVSFGWRYDFTDRVLHRSRDIPDFLLELRVVAARFAAMDPEKLQHVLVTEYDRGAPIGWHRDRPEFGQIVGISLLSPCTFRLRRRVGSKWERRSFTAEPRSAYLMSGPSRTEWEHSIPPVESLRYSVTFRNLREDLESALANS